MDKMDLDFPDNQINNDLQTELDEELVYKTKERLREMDEEKAKELLYWAILEMKVLKSEQREYREVKKALKIIKGILR